MKTSLRSLTLATLGLTALGWAIVVPAARSQTRSVAPLETRLWDQICVQNWSVAVLTAGNLIALEGITAEQRLGYVDLRNYLELLQLNVSLEEPEVLRSPQCQERSRGKLIMPIAPATPLPLSNATPTGLDSGVNPGADLAIEAMGTANPAFGPSPIDWEEATEKHKAQLSRNAQY